MKKALSMVDLMRKNREVYAFEGALQEAFGQPEQNGVWFIWGRSGNGKTSFVLQLCKELTRYGKVAYDSLEEGDSLTMQNALMRVGMGDVGRRFILLNESLKELDTRLKRRRSPDIVVVDSFQYAHIDLKQYEEFIEQHKNKLIIFVSQADGFKPWGAHRPKCDVQCIAENMGGGLQGNKQGTLSWQSRLLYHLGRKSRRVLECKK